MFILLPIFALLVKIVYAKRLFFDHLIFSLHLHSAAYILFALMLPLEALASRHLALLFIQALVMTGFLAYFVIAIRRVYQSSWFAVAWKSAIILFAYMVIVSIAMLLRVPMPDDIARPKEALRALAKSPKPPTFRGSSNKTLRNRE